ncbi:MAG: phosphate uptake regulator PhoU [Candidatus Bathyarchaeia archaeon]
MEARHEFEKVRGKVLEMGRLAKSALKMCLDGLMERDISLCDKVSGVEREADFLNLEVEDLCLDALSARRLSGRDFRFMATMMKVSERFERMTDLTVKIADLSRRGLPKPLLKPASDLRSMGSTAQEMIDITLHAISTDATVSTEELEGRDDVIDDLYEDLYGKLISCVHQNPQCFDDAVLLLIIAVTLERIGDLACKVGNRIVYIAEGKRVWMG